MLLGYATTAAVLASFAGLVAFIFIGRKELRAVLSKRTDKYSVAALVAVLAFFIVFAATRVGAVSQLYFDENIYQGVAINILIHGNALWCQYGTGYLQSCFSNLVYHDPVGWSVFIAGAFAIFGIGVNTAYGLELAVGALSIIAVFLLSSVVLDRKRLAVIAIVVFATMPQLYIWSRTQADIDLPFMMLATIAFFFFAVYAKKRSFNTLALFAFSLALVAYIRIEAMLLVAVFAALFVAFGDTGLRKSVPKNLAAIKRALGNNEKAILLLIVFLALLMPEIYYISLEYANPSYGQPLGQAVLSLSNFRSNAVTNALFLSGTLSGMNSASLYPTVFSATVMVLAILGTLLFALDSKRRDRFCVLLALWLWFAVYFVFYASFYAGSATYGVDSRFMLQTLPPLSMLAALSVFELGEAASRLAAGRRKGRKLRSRVAFCAVATALVVAAVAYPFATVVPVITMSPSSMPQQSVVLRAVDFFYSNYSAVPRNCLVFSFTPDMWYEVGVSSAQIGVMGSASVNSNMSRNECVVLDYGYWCVVPPFRNTTCRTTAQEYKTRVIASASAGNGYNTTFYQILNYS
jgi:Ca2+/Na+ antiporter